MTDLANQLIRLTDLQLILLTSAAQRPDGSLLPPPESIASQAARIRKAIPALLKRALVIEGPALAPAAVWRHDDERPIAVFITDAGRLAIGKAPASGTKPERQKAAANSLQSDQAAANALDAKKPSKVAQVVTLLHRPGGATLEELIAATGWLPHTTRAALTGLRKKKHTIVRGKRGDVTCYSITRAA